MTYKVIKWATGGLGSKAVAGIVGSPDMELVGAWVHSEEKEGRDVGELCGMEPVGVIATRDKDALLAMDADCVCFTGDRSWTIDPMPTVEELARILRSGKNVVNSTWPALVNPKALGNGVYEKLQEACLEGGSTLYTSGIDPGFGSIGLALAALSVTSEVRSVRTFEIMSYGTWDYPEMLGWMGFGQPDVDKCVLFTPGMTAGIFGSELTLLADATGVQLDEIVEDHSVIHAEEPFDTSCIHVPAGAISGMRFEIKGMIDGEAVLVVEHVTKLRDEDYPEVGLMGGGYRAQIDGEPCIKLDMELSSYKGDIEHAGYVACAMAFVNAIPQVCDAAPGILTYLDLLPHPSKNVPVARR
jgi:4-hydroxy-tetrahydrodipicolinate reductase